MEACVSIVGLKAILSLTNRELGATNPPGNSATSRSILRILLWLAQVGEILPIERNLLHLISLALKLAGEKRGAIANQLQDQTIAAIEMKRSSALKLAFYLFDSSGASS